MQTYNLGTEYALAKIKCRQIGQTILGKTKELIITSGAVMTVNFSTLVELINETTTLADPLVNMFFGFMPLVFAGLIISFITLVLSVILSKMGVKLNF